MSKEGEYGDWENCEKYYDEIGYNGNSKKKYDQYNNKKSNSNSISQIDNYPKLKMEEAMRISSYPKYIKDFIKDFIIKNYANNRNTKVYLAPVDNEKLFVIEYKLPVEVGNRTYHVFVLLYLPLLYPNYEPIFYISKKGNFGGISNFYKDGKIDLNTLKININYFVPFDGIRNNVEEIVNKLIEEFQKEFPIYKGDNLNPTGKCHLNKKIANEIIFENYNDNYVNTDKSKEKKINDNEFNDKSFCEFMRNQVKDILREKYINYIDRFKISKTYDEIKSIDNSINININNKKNNFDEIHEMKKDLEILRYIKDKLAKIERDLIYQNEEKIKSKNINILNKVDEFIKIRDVTDLNYIVMKKTIEDYLIYLKKGFEKKIISLYEMINKTRALSRELFYINYLRTRQKSH